MDELPENRPSRDTITVPADSAPFRKAIDSTVMIAITRFAWPAIVGLLGVLGAGQLSDLKEGQKNGLAELRATQIAGLSEVKDGQKQVWQQIGKVVDEQSKSNAIQTGLSIQVAATAKQLDRLQSLFDAGGK